jgi:hypothetical protein
MAPATYEKLKALHSPTVAAPKPTTPTAAAPGKTDAEVAARAGVTASAPSTSVVHQGGYIYDRQADGSYKPRAK